MESTKQESEYAANLLVPGLRSYRVNQMQGEEKYTPILGGDVVQSHGPGARGVGYCCSVFGNKPTTRGVDTKCPA